MTHLLHVDASPRGERSISRTLSREFVERWQATHPGSTVTYRDLGHAPVPHVTEAWIAAAFSSPNEHTPEMTDAIRLSDMLIDELLAADCYVFGVPMYNFSVPSGFKAYIDQIVRAGRTFAVTESGYKGLVEGKKALVITAEGGVYRPGSPAADYNFHEPYLRAILGFMGITDVNVIHADGLAMGDEARSKSLAEARDAIQSTVQHW
ncbi:MAG: FMN-dependent NADH-azoreductase [Synechococcales cyanobacterium C42_A2020_086]|jgi:FMN-dependent NADH-azoreductase|nr:FMN-dependent NADH-azoreductase [Synechococcales cyanobacterium M58_A2018_015]MBF2074945.1 FMN-dependent NADH-azoreductase [Synechococcales cyanobacterium C42_A2020_086]